jgi:hypothetical protein
MLSDETSRADATNRIVGSTKRGAVESFALISRFCVEEELKFTSVSLPNVCSFEATNIKQTVG